MMIPFGDPKMTDRDPEIVRSRIHRVRFCQVRSGSIRFDQVRSGWVKWDPRSRSGLARGAPGGSGKASKWTFWRPSENRPKS